MPDDSLERRRSSGNSNAKWKTCTCRKILKASKAENKFQDCCLCSPWFRSMSASKFCNTKVSGYFFLRTDARDWIIMQRVKCYRCTLANSLPLYCINALNVLHYSKELCPKIAIVQGRNEVRWRPGQAASSAPPFFLWYTHSWQVV